MDTPFPTDPAPASVPPGWHTDPWGQAPLRWWDGHAWTAQLSAPTGAFDGSPPAVDPVEQVKSAESTATWLSKVVFAMPVVVLCTVVGFGVTFRRFFDLIDEIDASPDADTDAQFNDFFADFGTIGSGFVALQLLNLLALLVLVLRMVWTYRIVHAARPLGRGGDRDPGLACASWIIPIVNLWWPYQTMRDLFPIDERPHNRLIIWWITYLLGAVAIGGAVFTLFLPTDALIAVAALAAASSAISAVLERQLVIEATLSVRRDAERA